MSQEEEESCSDGNLFGRIGCILTYGGSVQDTILNYLMILLNLAYCIKIVLSNFETNNNNNNNYNKEQAKRHQSYALGSFVFVMFFQVILCLLVGCSGVSIIWCAMGGWIMSERRRVVQVSNSIDETEVDNNNDADAYQLQTMMNNGSSTTTTTLADRLIYFGKVVILCDTAVIIYYMVVSPAITTVAHICALVLGAVLSEMSLRAMNESSSSTTTTTTSGGSSMSLGMEGPYSSPSSQRLLST